LQLNSAKEDVSSEWQMDAKQFFQFPKQYTLDSENANRWFKDPNFFYDISWVCYYRNISSNVWEGCVITFETFKKMNLTTSTLAVPQS
jgi:hypothetical protein